MKKALCGTCAAALIAAAGLGGAAVSAEEAEAGEQVQTIAESQDVSQKQLSEEEKAKREAMKEALKTAKEKWAALTDEQKQQIYALWDQSAALNSQMIDKYVELGVLDEKTAAALKEQLTEIQNKVKEKGKMPMLGKGGHRKGGKNSGEKPETSTTAAAS